MKRAPARHTPLALCCIIWLLLAAGCATPVGVERVDASTAQHELTANALTTDELSPSARNVLRRWVLSERYDDDPAGAIAALHTIATDGRGDEDEVITRLRWPTSMRRRPISGHISSAPPSRASHSSFPRRD